MCLKMNPIVISHSLKLQRENLDGTAIICLTRPRDISTRVTDKSTHKPYKNFASENLGLKIKIFSRCVSDFTLLVEWSNATDMVFCLLCNASRTTVLKVSKHFNIVNTF